MTATGRHVRRSRAVIAHWDRGRFTIQNYATGRSWTGSPLAAAILDAADRWIHRDQIGRILTWADAADLDRLVDALIAATALQVMGSATPEPVRSMEGWSGWNPAVGLYHMSTRDVPFAESPDEPLFTLGPARPPAPKSYPDAPRIDLPDYPGRGAFPGLLLRRRTWRRFERGSLNLDQLAALLGLTWGVQKWVDAGEPRLALKTSPSGGGLHSVEAYALVLHVDGVEPGAYHYDADGHRLERLRSGLSSGDMPAFLPGQPAYHDPCVVICLTSAFERVHWKYRHPRAYRVILLEAGHTAQTFCLVATWLGLAPFCTAALGESAIEEFLGVDGIREPVLYAVGAGVRPHGLDWAPLHDTPIPPATEPSEYRVRTASRDAADGSRS